TGEALRLYEEPDARARCAEIVAGAGGDAFFRGADWERILRRAAAERPLRGRVETEEERVKAPGREPPRARPAIAERTGRAPLHLCYPWHVSGPTARRIAAEAGYVTAFCGKVRGVVVSRAGSDPLAIARVGEDYVELLPGRGRVSLLDVLRRKWTR